MNKRDRYYEPDIAVISGKKVLEDDLTRWFVFCYVCEDAITDGSLKADDEREALEEHIAFHTSNADIDDSNDSKTN